MKTSIKLGLLLTCLSFSAMATAQECLRRASNRDLVAELESRLGGGSPSGNSAFASYLCKYDGDMTISVVNSAGTEVKAEIDIDKPANCNEMARVLSDNRSRISSTVVIGVCDYSGDMIRYTITPQGSLTKLSSTDIDNVTICIQQAAALNGGSRFMSISK